MLLVVDNLKVHHAQKVKAWIASHAREIELLYLPACAPDHHWDAYLNHDLKQKLRQNPPPGSPGSKDELVERTRSVMRTLPRAPARVRGYFRPAPVQYAA